jgi:hypothetical protein
MAGDAEATRFVARRSTLLRAFGRLASRRARRRYPSLPLRSLEYTTPQARPIIYAVGDFLETDLRDGRMLARPRGARWRQTTGAVSARLRPMGAICRYALAASWRRPAYSPACCRRDSVRIGRSCAHSLYHQAANPEEAQTLASVSELKVAKISASLAGEYEIRAAGESAALFSM